MKNDITIDTQEQIPNTQDDSVQIMLNLEQLIKNHITKIDKIKENLRLNREMLEDIFNNDPTYTQHAKEAKEAARIKGLTKKEILKQPQAKDLDSKVKEMSREGKELQDALSEYLREYQKMSGVNEIEGEDGEIREIVYMAKLIKKSRV